jgi:hypothetical protein
MEIPKELPETITIGDKYSPAMQVVNQSEADQYFEVLVAHSMKYFDQTREEAEILERSNLGYFAGYYGRETRARVERLFGCAHPVFGTIAEKGVPTVAEALLAAGVRAAKEAA